MIGKLLDGRYKIIQTLAAGGFGQTYLAHDTRRPGHPICVVKQLHPVSQDPQFLTTARRLFTTEAETLERLGMHSQIPRLLAYFEQEAEFYLVQDYVEGHPLTQELVKGQRWEEGKVIQLLRELLEVLTFVHGQNVIHRDVKPDNILRRDGDRRLVLVDFGAVKQIRSQVAFNPYGAANTVSVGTPGYMASEQARGQPCFASDLYSVGVIAIQALTGVSPQQFDYDSQTGEIVWQRDCCSPGLGAILERLVAYHFRERYQSAAEVLTVVSNLHVTAAPTAQLPALAPLPPPTVPPLSEQATLAVAPLEMSVHRVSPPKTARGGYTPTPKGKKGPNPLLLLFCSVFAVMFSVAFGATFALNRLQPQSGTANNAPRRSNPVLDWFGGREVSFERRPTCTVLVENGLNVRDRPNGQIVGGVERGTVLSLTGRKADDWVQINDPVEGWVSSQPQYVTCDQDFTSPVARESSPEPSSPPVASPTPERPASDSGGDILSRAQERFQNGDLSGAIELARSISRRSEAYRQAQNTMAQWQQEWQVLERRYEAARRALAERRWDDAIAHANTNPSEYEYWKTRFLQIAKEARDRKVEQERQSTPSTRPSPPIITEDSLTSPVVEKPQKPEEENGGWILNPPKPTPSEVTTPTFISPEPIEELTPSRPVAEPESPNSSFVEQPGLQ